MKNVNMSAASSSIMNKTMKLFPEDIEGAEISSNVLKKGTISKEKLMRWLKCRKGASTNGSNTVLLKRVRKIIGKCDNIF